MNRVILLTCAMLSLAAAPAAHARDMPPPQDLQQRIADVMRQARIPGLAIAKVEAGRIAWHGAFGQRAPGEPLAIDTVFNAASLTKPAFAALALRLVAEDVLQLDAPLHEHWIDPDVADDPRHGRLTARLALSHQSGLPNWRGKRALAFLFEPGARHEYSGEGYEYLRHAIERMTGKALPALMRQYVFQPAGMTRSAAGWADRLGDNVATGFDEAAEPIETALREREPNAAAHLMTTADDFARFAAWVSRGADLPPGLFADMRRPQARHDDPAERFGLGWKLVPLGDGEALMHDGREPGTRSYALVLPDRGEALVILTNSSNGELSFRPLVEAALPAGRRVMQSTDRLVWTYLTHLPPPALAPMSRGIARSPSFVSTLLHAVDTVLVQPSPLSGVDKAAATAAIAPYAYALLQGDIQPARAEALIGQLLVTEGDATRLVSAFSAQAARAWLAALLG